LSPSALRIFKSDRIFAALAIVTAVVVIALAGVSRLGSADAVAVAFAVAAGSVGIGILLLGAGDSWSTAHRPWAGVYPEQLPIVDVRDALYAEPRGRRQFVGLPSALVQLLRTAADAREAIEVGRDRILIILPSAPARSAAESPYEFAVDLDEERYAVDELVHRYVQRGYEVRASYGSSMAPSAVTVGDRVLFLSLPSLSPTRHGPWKTPWLRIESGPLYESFRIDLDRLWSESRRPSLDEIQVYFDQH
jgi:hypothetical protein